MRCGEGGVWDAGSRDAAHLVDDDSRELPARVEQVEGGTEAEVVLEPLGRRVQDGRGDARRPQRIEDVGGLGGRERRREVECADAVLRERGDLVVDEREQRRDDEGEALRRERRQLEAARLAGARRQQHELAHRAQQELEDARAARQHADRALIVAVPPTPNQLLAVLVIPESWEFDRLNVKTTTFAKIRLMFLLIASIEQY